MKVPTLLIVGLALVAASCTKTEVVSNGVQDNVKGIGFSAYTAKHTKAAQEDVTNNNLSSFNVTAIGKGAVYFDNVTFSKSTSGYWESNTKYYWPAYALSFYAHNTPTYGTFSRNITTDAQTLSFTPSTKLSEQEDLVAANAVNQSQSEVINLAFNHYLTQVIVKAKNSSSTYKVVVDGVKLANFINKGTYTFSSKTMTADGTKEKYEESITETGLTETPTEVMTNTDNGRWYLIPQTVTAWNQETEKTNSSKGTYLALKVKITANNGALKIYPATGDAFAWMAIPIKSDDVAFAQGHKYTIVVDFFSTTNNGAGYVDPEAPGELDGDSGTNDAGKSIIGGVIKFNADVNGWANETEITISL